MQLQEKIGNKLTGLISDGKEESNGSISHKIQFLQSMIVKLKEMQLKSLYDSSSAEIAGGPSKVETSLR